VLIMAVQRHYPVQISPSISAQAKVDIEVIAETYGVSEAEVVRSALAFGLPAVAYEYAEHRRPVDRIDPVPPEVAVPRADVA
jgi:hypothetical protein